MTETLEIDKVQLLQNVVLEYNREPKIVGENDLLQNAIHISIRYHKM